MTRQICNGWRADDLIAAQVLSEKTGRIAAQLRQFRTHISRTHERFTNEHGLDAGLALKPATPLDTVLPYLDRLDLVLTMTVEPGFGGQAFDDQVLPKVAAASRARKGGTSGSDGDRELTERGRSRENRPRALGRRVRQVDGRVRAPGSPALRHRPERGVVGWKGVGLPEGAERTRAFRRSARAARAGRS